MAKAKNTTHYKISDDKAARMMIALREGRTLRNFGVKTPRLEAYFKAHPEYARAAQPLIAANAQAAHLRKGQNLNKTHCPRGHSFAQHARVCMHKGYLSRQCRACEQMRYVQGHVIKPDVLRQVKARLAAKAPVTSFTRAGSPGYLLKFSTLARHRRENPEFNRLVLDVIEGSNRRAQLRRHQRARNNAVRDQNNDYYKILAMLPASYPGKDDVVSVIFEDLLTGRLKRDEVKARVQTYIAAHNRMFPTKFARFGDSLVVSLDEVMLRMAQPRAATRSAAGYGISGH